MTTMQVEFCEEELLASHPVAEPLIAGGVRCHGGFDTDGDYMSPRTLNRTPAIRAWQAGHAEQFGTTLLELGLDAWPEHYPNVGQAAWLIECGAREPIVTALTWIGASGRRYPGTSTVGPIWARAVAESLGTRRRQMLAVTLAEVEHALDAKSGRDDIIEGFHARGTVRPAPDGSWVSCGPAVEGRAAGEAGESVGAASS